MQLLPSKFLPALLVSTIAILTCASTAQAEDSLPATLVIIDTGIDSSLPIFEGHLIHEVCLLDWYLCPNGLNSQEGPGSATVQADVMRFNGFDHGTQMASVALSRYANLRFIMVRVVGNSNAGLRMKVSDDNVARALEWVSQNKEKFNIRAVSMSQGHRNTSTARKYCPVVPRVQKTIVQLKSAGIGVFFPTGNQADKKRIDWPACIPEAIAIGAIDEKDEITKYSNMDFALTDMYALGKLKAIGAGGLPVNSWGTSVSTQVAAVQWIEFVSKHPQAPYSEVFMALRTSGELVFDSDFRFGRKIDLAAALAQYESKVMREQSGS